MNLKNIDLRNLNKRRLLASLGLQAVPSAWSVTTKLVAFIGIGAAAGAAVALLVSPKAGRDIRRSLRRSLRQGIDEVLDVLPDKVDVPLSRGA